jgi:anti-sigma factor RsiW
MIQKDPQITEFDLLAYADGRLDGDPLHKERVRAYLDENPAEADRVNDYSAQNAQIERHYGAVLCEPVPERLLQTLASHFDNRRTFTQLSKLTATVLLCSAMAGVSGWWLGRSADETDMVIPAFVTRALADYDMPMPRESRVAEMPPPPKIDAMIKPPSDRINLAVRISNLIPKGFRITKKHIIKAAGEETLRLDLSALDGRNLSLFLGARGWNETPATRIAKKGNTSAVYWHDGPLSFGLISRMTREEVLRVAETIRHSARFRRRILDEHMKPNDGKGQGLAAHKSVPPKSFSDTPEIYGNVPQKPFPPARMPGIVNDL